MEISYRNPQWQRIFSLSLDLKKAQRTLSWMAFDTGNVRSSGRVADQTTNLSYSWPYSPCPKERLLVEINRRNTSYLKQLVVWVTNLEQSLAASYHPSTDWYRGAEKQQTDTPLTLKTWTSTTNPNFAPHMWNQHEAVQMMIPRSSNIAEGWHHGFHSMLSCSKPTIWKFLDSLKQNKP